MADLNTRQALRLAVGTTSEAEYGPEQSGGERSPQRRRRLLHGAGDLRLKFLSLLLLSALGPVLLVGTASYLIARSIMTEKIASQLDVQASWGAERVTAFLEARSSDAEVFSQAALVADNLRVWEWAQGAEDEPAAVAAQARLKQYLEQIADRYSLYGTLAMLDSQGDLIAAAVSAESPMAGVAAAFTAGERDQVLLRDGHEVRLATRKAVRDGEGALLGFLIAVCGLNDLFEELAGGPHPGLRVVDAAGEPLFEGEPAIAGRVWDQLRREPTAEYRGADGRVVLAALRFPDRGSAAVLVETDRTAAFAPIYRLRGFTIWVSVVATLLVAAVGFALVVNLIRPIEALIAGAKAAARGDLSQEIPVSSSDQIGHLTRMFNHMVRTVRDSRARLELLSSTDALTGLMNRRELAATFDSELDRARRFDDPLSVLMIDLDRFKAFNDRHGHQAGDSVLHLVGGFLSGCLRSIDIAARYGGEEFLILLPSTDREGAVELAERLRRSFKRAYREDRVAETEVTLSVGVAAFPQDGSTAEELVRAADGALYDAKRNGRDRVSVAAAGQRLRAVPPVAQGSRP